MFASRTGSPVRILYLAQWFEPEPMIKGAGFVTELIARGHEVQVVTGFPNYPFGKLYDGYRLSLHKRDVAGGVPIDRVPLYPSHNRSSIGRMANYISFMVSATLFGIFRARRFDVVYAYPPITVGLAAAAIAKVRRRPFVIDIQDLWPDSVVVSGMAGTSRMAGILHALCNFTYRSAARIVAQSMGIAARLQERGVPAEKIDVIYNSADESAAAASGTCDLSPYGFGGAFNIVYGGNLGHMQGLDTLIRAAHAARNSIPHLRLTLIGDGMEGARLRALVAELNATNVGIFAGVPRSEIGDVFASADVLVLHLLDDPLFEITIPQKTQFYLAMGKPILIGMRGEAARFIVDAEAGIAIPPGDVGAIAAAMVSFARMPVAARTAMGARGRSAYEEKFSFATTIGATEATLTKAIDA